MEKNITKKPRTIFRLNPSPDENKKKDDRQDSPHKKIRVAAYCRISSGSDEQLTLPLHRCRPRPALMGRTNSWPLRLGLSWGSGSSGLR